MKRIMIGVAAIVGLFYASANAMDAGQKLPGRSASAILDARGHLVIAYQNERSGLGLAEFAPDGQPAGSENLTPSPAAGNPVMKADGLGRIGIVWSEIGRDASEIYFGRIEGRMIKDGRPVLRAKDALFSPDLAFDESGRPWIACVRSSGPVSDVLVSDIGRSVVWSVNGRLTASALAPKLAIGPEGQVWVVWTGQDQGQDEIFVSTYRNSLWSPPQKIDDNDRYPHVGPVIGIDAEGHPWIAWSAFDSRTYQIFSATWDGLRWSEAEAVSSGTGSETSPAVAFISGGIPLVVWSRSSGRTNAVLARFKRGPDWSPIVPVTQGGPSPVRSLRLARRGTLLALTWESADGAEFLALDFSEIVAMAGRNSAATTISPIINPALDDNQYTGFGDSITYAENRGYLPRLEPLLVSRYGLAEVWNEGEGGETTGEGLARIDSALAAHASRYLMLMEGTNDVIFLEISMRTAAFNLEEMAKKCLRQGLLPLIATIIPRNDGLGRLPLYWTRITDLNTYIRQLAQAEKIPLVDQFNAFYDYPAADGGWTSLLLEDGVHPNPKGFDLMAQTWYDSILVLPFPPQGLQVARKTGISPVVREGTLPHLVIDRPGNALRWANNPKWATGRISVFKVYRRSLDGTAASYVLAGTVVFLSDVSEHKFFDPEIDLVKRYAYAIAAESSDGVEGPCSGIVQDYH